MNRYPDSIIEQVKNSTSLVELVSARTEVKQSGSNFTACCPFHAEKTPSFHINEIEGLYYCFGCGKKGNTFTFIMETRSISFPEAIRYLADRASIKLPQLDNTPSHNDRRSQKSDGQILSALQIWYETYLQEDNDAGRRAKQLLRDRGISDETERLFKLGYAPNLGRDPSRCVDELTKILNRHTSVQSDQVVSGLKRLGLLREKSGLLSTLFWDRIMFPITKSNQSIIGFGGRLIQSTDKAPKYINSPESHLYSKRKALYGLGTGFVTAQKHKSCFLVEGYFDVVSMTQSGMANTFAVCGTALTPEHKGILSRFVNRIYLLFDGDGAGFSAAAKALPVFINTNIDLIPVCLPEGEDPDSLCREFGSKKIKDIVKSSEDSLLKIYIEAEVAKLRGTARGSRVDLGSLRSGERSALAEKLAGVIGPIDNPVLKNIRIEEASDLLGLSKVALEKLIDASIKTTRSYVNTGEVAFQSSVKNPQISNEASRESTNNRRLKSVIRQLMVALIVDPTILESSEIRSQIAELGIEEPRLNLLAKLLSKSRNDAAPVQGLSTWTDYNPSDDADRATFELSMAFIKSAILESDLSNEGLEQEALQQLKVGGDVHKRLVAGLTAAADRAKISDSLELLRLQEGRELELEARLELAQEKLLAKRRLTKG